MATIVKDKPEVEGTSDLEEHIEENEFGSDDDVESILEDDDEEEEAPVESGGVKAFASAFKTIVTRDLGTKQKDPILAEDKGVVEKIEEEKEEAKIRRKLAAHKKALRTAFHVEEPPVMEIPLEREYRRIATKGVVAVFNAVKTFRTPVEEVADDVDEEGEEVTAAQEEVPNTRNKGGSPWLMSITNSDLSAACSRIRAGARWSDAKHILLYPDYIAPAYMPITTSSILRQAAAGAAVESSAVGSLRPQDVRRVLSTLSKKRRTDIGMWKAALTQAVEAMEARSNPSHLDVSYILHACTRSPKNVKEESAAVVSACLRRAMSRVDTFSCRSLAAIASSCVRLADERFPELVDGSEEMPAITEVFDCFAGALGKRHRPTQSKYRVKDVALLCHSFSKFPTALTIHVLFQQILREGILVTTEVDGEDDATMHVKDLAQILSACSRVSIRDSEVVAACARFVPGQCKYMDGQGLAIVWRALSRLMYSETATRVDEDGAPIEAAYDERSCYEALQSRLPMVIHQMSWQEVGMVAQAASRTRAHQLARDSDRAWAEVAKCLVHHAMTTLAPVCQPADAHSLTCLIYGVGLLSQLQRSDAASKSSRRLIQQQDTSGLGDLARKILWSSPPSSTVLRDISRTAAGLAALGLEPSHAFWHALETHSLPSENCETKNASLRLTDPSDIANATLALALATKRLPVEFSKSWLGEEGSWSFSALAAVVHACALSGSGGNDIVGELGRRVAAQTWELYSYGPGEGDNLAKTAVELWWLQGRLPGKLERYLREATRSMSTRARGVAEELLRQPEIRDREPSTAKKNRTVQTWTYWIAEDQNVTRATKLVVRSAPEASEAKMELSSFRDFIGVGCPPDVAAAARKMSDILGVPWDAYPIPLLRYPSPSGKVVNFIIVNQNGWVPSDLAVAAGCSGGQTSTVALVAEDAYKYHAIIKEVLKVC